MYKYHGHDYRIFLEVLVAASKKESKNTAISKGHNCGHGIYVRNEYTAKISRVNQNTSRLLLSAVASSSHVSYIYTISKHLAGNPSLVLLVFRASYIHPHPPSCADTPRIWIITAQLKVTRKTTGTTESIEVNFARERTISEKNLFYFL